MLNVAAFLKNHFKPMNSVTEEEIKEELKGYLYINKAKNESFEFSPVSLDFE